jgi:uncharacterized protein YegJ (DUF2314 family)
MSNKKIFFASGDSPKLAEAFKKAQETFNFFWRELSWEYRRIIPALNVACVKVAFTQEKENSDEIIVEHMWINEVEFDGNNVKGILINNPNELTNIANGASIEIPLSQISDWLFAITETKKKGFSTLFKSSSSSRAYGGFTIQAMRSEMTNQERKEHDNAWGLNFLRKNLLQPIKRCIKVFIIDQRTQSRKKFLKTYIKFWNLEIGLHTMSLLFLII